MTIEGNQSPLFQLYHFSTKSNQIHVDFPLLLLYLAPYLYYPGFWVLKCSNSLIVCYFLLIFRCGFLLECSNLCLGTVLAGLAFMFSSSILLQILACAIYGNWWPMLSALMYVVVPMPCMFFGGGSTQFLTSRDGGGWIDAAKFLTGASTVGSLAIPIILRHAQMIETGAMLIEFTSFFIFICTVMCFHRASLDDDW
ncbi:Vacuolar protein sorting 55 [Arabidopsis suecica]|uniref:Vacuolar protein sorting 55 n=2 Tax=Arabidopsis TaxID=3701 RepID=A0A8T2B4K6_ARASU|nr:Vacuolar protein sorting 55 [Arabidopsis suecica]